MKNIFLTIIATVLFVTLPKVSHAMPEDCDDGRIFLESQSWWTPTDPNAVTVPGDQDGPHDFGHVHIGTCFPLEQEIGGVVSFDLRIIMHNYPDNARLKFIHAHIRGKNTNGNPFTVSTVKGLNLDLTDPPSGECVGQTTCVIRRTVTLNTLDAPVDGRQEFRFLLLLEEPDQQEMHVSTGWTAILNNSNPNTVNYRPDNNNFIEGRGWYTTTNYVNAQLNNTHELNIKEDYLLVPLQWQPKIRTVKGAEGGNDTSQQAAPGTTVEVTHSRIMIDPAFHANPPYEGEEVWDGAGEFNYTNNTVLIDFENNPKFTRFNDGEIHTLAIKADGDCGAPIECTDELDDIPNPPFPITNEGQRGSGLLLVPFKVDNSTGTVTFRATDTIASEANSNVTVKITSSQTVQQNTSLTYQTATYSGTANPGGSATATQPADFGWVGNGTATIQAGNDEVSVSIPINGDMVPEDTEHFYVRVNSVTHPNHMIGADAAITILDDDDDPTGPISFRATNTNVSEADPSVSVKIISSQPVQQNTSLTYQTATYSGSAVPGGSATASQPADFSWVGNGTATIQAGNDEVSVSIPLNGDTIPEGNERFYVRVNSVTHPNHEVGADAAIIILDND